jgi:hypothetical protein
MRFVPTCLCVLMAVSLPACSSDNNDHPGSGSDGGTGGSSGTGGGAGTGGGQTGGAAGGDGAAAPVSDLAKECAADADCAAGLKCLTPTDASFFGGGAAHGYCSVDCPAGMVNPVCTQAGGVCISTDATGQTAGICVLECTPGSAPGVGKCQGRGDLACSVISMGAAAVCLPVCSQDSDCSTGRICNPRLGVCSDTAPAGDPLGAHCNPDPDAGANTCASGRCAAITEDGMTISASFCSMPCVFLSKSACGHTDGALGTGSHGFCALTSSQTASAGDLGSCVQECETTADCLDQAEPGAACDLSVKADIGHGLCWGAAAAPGPDAGDGG